MTDPLLLDLRCPACSWTQAHTQEILEERLRGIGMLKRNPHPSDLEVMELALAAAGRLTCPACRHTGLIAAPSAEQDAQWPGVRNCAVCGQPIPPERLEVFPDATTCVKCQRADEQGRAPGAPDYCPKCGAPMIVRQTRGQGITRYTAVCSNQPPCRS